MKATGIVRRMDELGRVVVPKELRRVLRIRDGDPLEIFTESDGSVIFKKYSQLADLSTYALQYVEALNKVCGKPAVICDRDTVIAAAGIPQKELLHRRISEDLEHCVLHRRKYPYAKREDKLLPIEGVAYYALVGTPIINVGDAVGYLLLVGENAPANPRAQDADIKAVAVTAALLERQLEFE